MLRPASCARSKEPGGQSTTRCSRSPRRKDRAVVAIAEHSDEAGAMAPASRGASMAEPTAG